MEAINRSMYLFLNQYVGESSNFDQFSVFIADKTPYFFIFILLLLWLLSHNKNKNAHYKHNVKQSVLTSGFACILGVIINRIMTALYFHPRPFMDKLGTILGEHKAEGSFPSDHTTFVFCLALTWLSFQETRTTGKQFFVLALISGILRVYIGVHYPFDIFGSFLVALLVVGLLQTIFKNIIRKLTSRIISIYEKLYAFFFSFFRHL